MFIKKTINGIYVFPIMMYHTSSISNCQSLVHNTDNNILFSFQGIMDYKIIDSILNNAIQALDKSGLEIKLQKKSYRIMMETLENIQKHAYIPKQTSVFPQFIIVKNVNEIIFKTINIINNENIKTITNNIENINSSSISKLKEMQEYKLINGELTAKGGSGIGLINIAIRSNNKLVYSIEALDKETSCFVLQIKINTK